MLPVADASSAMRKALPSPSPRLSISDSPYGVVGDFDGCVFGGIKLEEATAKGGCVIVGTVEVSVFIEIDATEVEISAKVKSSRYGYSGGGVDC